jgi:hypothetical protein
MKSIRLSDKAYDRLEEAVWDVVREQPLEGDWWADVHETFYGPLRSRSGEATGLIGRCCKGHKATTSGKLFVRIEADYEDYLPDGSRRRKTLSKRQLVVAFLSLKSQTHCGSYHLLEDPDICSADTILQQALFGKLTFG